MDGSAPPDALPGVLYGAQTIQALANFAVPGPRLAEFPGFVRALVRTKMAAATANLALGALSAPVAAAILAAGQEILDGAHLEQFPLPVRQGGGGTSTNMNVNEVLATRAEQLLVAADGTQHVHPNDHVNRSQSTNDVLPTAIAVATLAQAQPALAALAAVGSALDAKAAEYDGLLHLGRTCLQDAVAIPVSDVHRAQAYSVATARRQLAAAVEPLAMVPLGATAIGTGLGAPDGFRDAALDELRSLTGLPLRPSPSPSFSLASLEPLVHVCDAIDQAGRVLSRIAADLRLLASGPHAGLGEIVLPAVQPGSSIMPGKTNPVIPELVLQVGFELAGAATTAHLAAAAGELEVSAMAPAVTLGLLRGLDSLAAVARIFADRCIAGLRWDRSAVAANLHGALDQAVERAVTAGYDVAAREVRERIAAQAESSSVRTAGPVR